VGTACGLSDAEKRVRVSRPVGLKVIDEVPTLPSVENDDEVGKEEEGEVLEAALALLVWAVIRLLPTLPHAPVPKSTKTKSLLLLLLVLVVVVLLVLLVAVVSAPGSVRGTGVTCSSRLVPPLCSIEIFWFMMLTYSWAYDLEGRTRARVCMRART
jgi:hypothetical protein